MATLSPGHQRPVHTLYATRSRSTSIPASTLWQRANNKPFLADKAASQQYFIPQEKQALVGYMLRLADNGYSLPVKFLLLLAVVIIKSGIGLPLLVAMFVGKDNVRKYRGATVKRALVTASILALHYLAGAIHCSSRTIHASPGWQFSAPRQIIQTQKLTERVVGHKLLICNGFGTHESLEVLKFCFANHIILCCFSFYMLRKLQTCDVDVFSFLKTAYRAQIEQACRAGVNNIGKPQFIYLYDRIRAEAFTPRNIQSVWSRSGLFPFGPSRVLRDIQMSRPEAQITFPVGHNPTVSFNLSHTPNTSDQFALLCKEVEQDTYNLDSECKHRLQTLTKRV
ncbi:hypothetical protein N7450_011667 [Penicillium hetheringtonii]|uniref:DDE-1 domain-containing protein n=1 Tax=Penicillium hetheringtonii TaxID=911720 RepID=A0AAD6GL64_9EURO|nr:hypothetical protein N7450_011667 [Penicillium hetheringtonii]